MSFIVASYGLLILFAATSAVVATLAYQRAAISAPIKLALTGLRAVVVFLALTLLLEPALQFKDEEIRKPKLALLIDDSESLTISDGGIRRDSLLKQILSKNLSALSTMVDIQPFFFGEALKRATSDDLWFQKPPPKEKYSNHSEALASIKRIGDRENFNAVLMFSDGEFNVGENPVYEAEKALTPIFTVLIGDTNSRKDVALRRIFAPEQTIVNTTTSISAVIAQAGFTGSVVEVLLKSGDAILGRKQISLASSEQSISFEFTPKEIGESKYTLSVSAIKGEFSTKNNAQSVFIDVLKSRKKVLVIAGLPDPEISAIRQTLAQAENFEGVFFSQRSPTEFFEGELKFDEQENIDACILIGFPSASISENISERVFQFLKANQVPTLSLIGIQSSGARLKQYEPLLAVNIGRTNPLDVLDNTAFATITPLGQSFVTFKAIASSLAAALQLAPSLTYIDWNFQAKSNSQILWKLTVGGRATEKIILSVLQGSTQKSATMCAAQFWHYALSPDESVRNLYAQTILGLLEWLCAKDDVKRFLVAPSRKVYDEGEAVVLTATLQDELFNPVSAAQVSLRIKRKETDEIVKAVFEPATEAGVYTARIEGIAKGEYIFSAEAKESESIIGTTSGAFSVSETNAEFRNTAANPETMRGIAERSGGKVYSADSFAQFLNDVPKEPALQPIVLQKSELVEFANLGGTLLFILLCLSAEWLLRKFQALP